jgi:hypothetical protein
MNTLYWTIYWIGVVLFPIVIGMTLPNKNNFKVFDEGIPFFFLSLMWPFVIAICAAGMIVLGIVALVGFLWSFLMELGSSFGRKLETPKKEEVLKSDGSK